MHWPLYKDLYALRFSNYIIRDAFNIYESFLNQSNSISNQFGQILNATVTWSTQCPLTATLI